MSVFITYAYLQSKVQRIDYCVRRIYPVSCYVYLRALRGAVYCILTLYKILTASICILNGDGPGLVTLRMQELGADQKTAVQRMMQRPTLGLSCDLPVCACVRSQVGVWNGGRRMFLTVRK